MIKRITYQLGGLLLFVVSMHGCFMKGSKSKNAGLTFDYQGHRGCRGLMPENTIPAMFKAIDLGVTTLEMDVVITSDNQVIVSHEPFFSHEFSTTPEGKAVEQGTEKEHNIYRMTYAQTQEYDVGLRTHERFPKQQKIAATKPLLSVLIDSVENYCKRKKLPKVRYNIETKCLPSFDNLYHPKPDEFAELLMGVILEKKIQSRVTIQSFDFRTLQYIRKNHPRIPISALVEPEDNKPFPQILKLLGFLPDVYSPHFSMVTPLMVRRCKDMGVKLVPWTVNDLPTLKKMKAMGVDGVISDYPDLYKKL